MALEAVVSPQDLLCCTLKEMYSLGGGSWCWEIGDELVDDQKTQAFYENWEASCSSMQQGFDEWEVNSSTPTPEMDAAMVQKDNKSAASSGRRKRRRTRSLKNKEEVENQRMTHIAVERNRRKQMNEYLSVLRSLMPPSYVQKSDQASIIGGAINFVKELEQLLQSLEVHKQLKHKQKENSDQDVSAITSPLATFFTFPQYSSTTKVSSTSATSIAASTTNSADVVAANPSSVADIEVTMVESHANLKVLSKRRPKQLLKLVVGLQNIRLTTLHLSVNTVEPMVLYSFSLKVEDDCQMTSMDGIAAAVHRILERIHEEDGF